MVVMCRHMQTSRLRRLGACQSFILAKSLQNRLRYYGDPCKAATFCQLCFHNTHHVSAHCWHATGRRWYLGAPERTVTPSLYGDQHGQRFWEPRSTSVLKEGLLHTRSNIIHHRRHPLAHPLHSRCFSAPEGAMGPSLLVCLSAMTGMLGTTTNFQTQRRPSPYQTQHYTPLTASFDSAIAQPVFQCTEKNYEPLSPYTSTSNDRDAGNHN